MPKIFKRLKPKTRSLLRASLINGVFWSAILLLLSYLKTAQIQWSWLPIWFLFFALTGGIRRYYLDKKSQ
jgi:hypothetical protein